MGRGGENSPLLSVPSRLTVLPAVDVRAIYRCAAWTCGVLRVLVPSSLLRWCPAL